MLKKKEKTSLIKEYVIFFSAKEPVLFKRTDHLAKIPQLL